MEPTMVHENELAYHPLFYWRSVYVYHGSSQEKQPSSTSARQVYLHQFFPVSCCAMGSPSQRDNNLIGGIFQSDHGSGMFQRTLLPNQRLQDFRWYLLSALSGWASKTFSPKVAMGHFPAHLITSWFTIACCNYLTGLFYKMSVFRYNALWGPLRFAF